MCLIRLGATLRRRIREIGRSGTRLIAARGRYVELQGELEGEKSRVQECVPTEPTTADYSIILCSAVLVLHGLSWGILVVHRINDHCIWGQPIFPPFIQAAFKCIQWANNKQDGHDPFDALLISESLIFTINVIIV